MDIASLLFVIGFEGALVIVAALLVVTFLAFRRMNNDVRRARMFIMADRVTRFLGAFTLGFVVITADFVIGVLSLPDAVVIGAGAIIVFLASILYGSLELFWVVRPRRKASALPRSRSKEASVAAAPRRDSGEGEADAPR